jgi:DNA polymerase III subunit alpha
VKGVSLHHHTTYSYGDGYGTPDQHVARAVELDMSALACTEHGNVSSHVKLERAADKAGIKALFGCELYCAVPNNQRKWHLTALAMDQEGYHNLNMLVTRAWAEGFYYWPTVHGAMLREHAAGLIVLSGCADSQLACALLGGKGVPTKAEPDMAAAVGLARAYKRTFGDRYYLEVQQFPELNRTCMLNTAYAKIGKQLGIPLVATADVHYPLPEHNEMQKILHAATRSTGTVAAAEAEWEYGIHLTHPLSDKFWHKRLVGTGLTGKQASAAIAATAEIAGRCNVRLPRNEPLRYPCGDALALIWDWIKAGWKYRWSRNAHMRANKKAYKARVKYEMELIELKDYMDYFLMLSDEVRTFKDNEGPVGPARGSAAASLVCYLLRITEVDPMMFPTMMFERFIDPNRTDLPDIDLDFADDRRDEVRLHAIAKYGVPNVGNIGNFVRYRGKNAVIDVARVYRLPWAAVETVKALVVERSGGDSRFDASLADTRDMFPQVQQIFKTHPELDRAIDLEGNLKGMSVHAAGLVISNKPITDTCALYTRTMADGRRVSVLSVDKKDAEYLGMLKADFLGLSTMGMIDIALRDIGMKLADLYDVPLSDKATLAAFKRNDVAGIFQFEGRATRLVNADVSPDTFMHLADVNALSRPGPLFSGATAQYCEVKHGRQKPVHLHPIVDAWTKTSNYQIIYQEQVLGIIREIGGFPVTKVADIRKIISQKLGEASFNAMREEFINGARQHHKLSEQRADKIWRLMVTSATYSFNVAHCVSYAMLGFWCMWLKVHHPAAFYAAQLTKTSKEDWPRLIRDAERHGIKVVGPHIQKSARHWQRDRKKALVRAGFEQIPGVAGATASNILAWRASRVNECKPTWDDLIEVYGIGPKTIEHMVAFAKSADPFELHRNKRILDVVRAEIAAGQYAGLPIPSHRGDEIPADADKLRVFYLGIPHTRQMKDYIEDQRARTGEDIAEILKRTQRPDMVTSCVLQCSDDTEEDVYLRFHRLVYPRFRAAVESVELKKHVVLAAGWKRRGFGTGLHVDRLWVIEP